MSQTATAPAAERRIRGYCALCRSRCGCISVVRDGRLVAVEPDPEHPTGKALCAKGRAAPELVHAPDRLLHPMRRTNPKGAADPGWRRISWDEALDETAAAMRRIAEESGPEAVAFAVTTPSGTAMSDAIHWVERLIRAFGSPNTVYGTEICNWHKDFATAFTFGAGVGAPDYENTGCIVHWGHNPNASWLVHAQRTAAAKARGARLVVIDPRRVGGAVKADQWLRVRPGADAALALGLAHVMIENGWFDRDFMRRWSTGPFLVHPRTGRYLTGADLEAGGDGQAFVAWDEAAGKARAVRRGEDTGDAALALLGTHAIGRLSCKTAFQHYADACRRYPPDTVAELAWVPAEQVVETARLVWESRPVSYYAWSGVGMHTNATQTDRAIALFYALTGSYDAPGGNLVHAKVPIADVSGRDLIGPGQAARALGLDTHPLGPPRDGWVTSDAFYAAVLEQKPYAVRGLVAFGTNMLVSHADTQRGSRALAGLDFHVHADLFLNPSAVHADIVLPVSSAWEREGLRAGFEVDHEAQQLVQLRAPVVAPRGEARSDTEIAFALAERLGLGIHFWNGDVEAGLRAQLAPAALTPEMLRARPQGVSVPLAEERCKHAVAVNGAVRGFATPSRRVEVWSQQMAEHGQAALPEHLAGEWSGAAAAFPLLLTGGKSALFCHSQGRNLASLRRKASEPVIELHPELAAARGIGDGDAVDLVTPAGRFGATARHNAALDPRVVTAQYGWWQGCAALGLAGYAIDGQGGANYNAAIGNRHADPVSGSVPHRSYPCDVRRARHKGTETASAASDSASMSANATS